MRLNLFLTAYPRDPFIIDAYIIIMLQRIPDEPISHIGMLTMNFNYLFCNNFIKYPSLVTFIYSHLLKFSPSHYVCNHNGTMTSADFLPFVVTTSFILRFRLLTRPP